MNITFDELVKVVTEKAAVTPEQARKAVTVVIEELKAKLPAPIAAQLDMVFKEMPLVAGKA